MLITPVQHPITTPWPNVLPRTQHTYIDYGTSLSHVFQSLWNQHTNGPACSEPGAMLSLEDRANNGQKAVELTCEARTNADNRDRRRDRQNWRIEDDHNCGPNSSPAKSGQGK